MNLRWLTASILVAGCSRGVCVEEWCWQNPLPQGNSLRAVHAFAPDDVWAAGDVGTVLHWDGARWTRTETNPFDAHGFADWTITSLWGAAPDDVWATTRWGRGVLHWDGARWSQMQDKDGNPRAQVVRGTARDDVWAIEENARMWHWDGKTWLAVAPAGLANAIATRAKNDVWAAGAGPTGSLAHWDGSTWTHIVPEPDAAFREYTGLQAFGPSELWLLGPLGLLRGDGANWIAEPSPLVPPGTANPPRHPRLHGTSSSDVWAWEPGGAITHWNGTEWKPFEGWSIDGLGGSGPADVWSAGPLGDLRHWDGAKWTSASSSLTRFEDVLAIGGSSASDVWAFGERGLALHWDGKRWSRVDLGRDDTLLGVWGAASDDLWAVGRTTSSTGLVLHFDGSVWSEVKGIDATFTGVCGTGSNDVWLHGRALFHWDGTTWSDFHSSGGSCSVVGTNDVWFVQPNTLRGLRHWDGSELKAVDFGGAAGEVLLGVWAHSSSDVWALGSGTTHHWDGESWKEFRLEPGFQVGFDGQILGVAANDVWALTNHGLFHWTGDRWTELPPIFPRDSLAPGVMWASGESMWLAGQRGAILRRR